MTAPVQGLAATLQRIDFPSTTAPTAPTEAPTAGFAERLEEMVEEVNTQQATAERAAEDYADGRRTDLHGTMIALEQADISFRFVSNVRGRLIEAYREVMRMGS